MDKNNSLVGRAFGMVCSSEKAIDKLTRKYEKVAQTSNGKVIIIKKK